MEKARPRTSEGEAFKCEGEVEKGGDRTWTKMRVRPRAWKEGVWAKSKRARAQAK